MPVAVYHAAWESIPDMRRLVPRPPHSGKPELTVIGTPRFTGLLNCVVAHVDKVVVKSFVEPKAGPITAWADRKVKATSARLDVIGQKLDDTRGYRQVRGLIPLCIGLLMANFAALAAILFKMRRQ
jgi:hypothetical protein